MGQLLEDETNDGKELRRLAVETALASTFKDIRNPYITWEDLKQLITVCMPDHVRARWWFDEIRKYRGGEGDLPPSTFPMMEMLQDEILVAVCERVNYTDPLTVIAAMNYNSQTYFDFNDYHSKVFIKPFLKHNGILVQCSGLMGSGKTDFALKITEMLLDNGFVVITNIRCPGATRVVKGEYTTGDINNLYMVTRMTDLLLQLIRMRRDGKNVVIVFDETSIFYNRQSATTRENISIGVFLRLIRKFAGSCIFIEQLERGLATIADNLTVSRFHKISQKKLQYSTSTLGKNYNLFLDSIPKTNIDFDTLDLAGFSLDIDFKKMMMRIDIDAESKMDDIKDYIENLRNKSPVPNLSNSKEENNEEEMSVDQVFESMGKHTFKIGSSIVISRNDFQQQSRMNAEDIDEYIKNNSGRLSEHKIMNEKTNRKTGYLVLGLLRSISEKELKSISPLVYKHFSGDEK